MIYRYVYQYTLETLKTANHFLTAVLISHDKPVRLSDEWEFMERKKSSPWEDSSLLSFENLLTRLIIFDGKLIRRVFHFFFLLATLCI